MAVAIVLSGGVGARMDLDSFPKQYVEVAGQPIIMYAMQSFDATERVESIIVVAEERWQGFVARWCEEHGIATPVRFAPAGATRQHSVRNGLIEASANPSADDVVIVHDAARPNLSTTMIDSYLDALKDHDGIMPALPVKDTIYATADGRSIGELLDRDRLRSGQAPELFRFAKYLAINRTASEEELSAMRGSSEIAFRHGLEVRMVEGSEGNYKITTREDLKRFCEDRGDPYEGCLARVQRALVQGEELR